MKANEVGLGDLNLIRRKKAKKAEDIINRRKERAAKEALDRLRIHLELDGSGESVLGNGIRLTKKVEPEQ